MYGDFGGGILAGGSVRGFRRVLLYGYFLWGFKKGECKRGN